MRPAARVCVTLLAFSIVAGIAAAQEPPPPIGPFVLDVHGTIPRFPNDDAQLAASRAVSPNELPGAGLGIHAGIHVYPLKWKAVTFGLGGELTVARSHLSSQTMNGEIVGQAVTERFTHLAPELSFNFGSGDGWSYISGGIGPSTWSIVPDGSVPLPPNEERLYTINYGGGARWFAKRHLAFSFDVRFYAINPGTPLNTESPGGPRTTLLIFGAGVSVR
jgi:hypothetical protein